MADKCSQTNEVFAPPNANGEKKYRFFTLPIEQIPGYKSDEDQILIHRSKSGLQWATVDQCLSVVTCLQLESTQLVAKRSKIVVIKDFGDDQDNPCKIDVTDCETGS